MQAQVIEFPVAFRDLTEEEITEVLGAGSQGRAIGRGLGLYALTEPGQYQLAAITTLLGGLVGVRCGVVGVAVGSLVGAILGFGINAYAHSNPTLFVNKCGDLGSDVEDRINSFNGSLTEAWEWIANQGGGYA